MMKRKEAWPIEKIRDRYYCPVSKGLYGKEKYLPLDEWEKMKGSLVYFAEVHRYVTSDNFLSGTKSLQEMLKRDGVVLDAEKEYVIVYSYDCFRFGTAAGSNYWYGHVFEKKA